MPGKTALANPTVPATGPQPESSRCIPGRSRGWRNRASTSAWRRACVTTRPTGDGRAGSDHGALYLSVNPPVSCTDLVMACPKGTSSRAALSRCGHDVRRVRASAPSSCRPSRSLGRGSSWVFQKTLAGKRHWATSRAGRRPTAYPLFTRAQRPIVPSRCPRFFARTPADLATTDRCPEPSSFRIVPISYRWLLRRGAIRRPNTVVSAGEFGSAGFSLMPPRWGTRYSYPAAAKSAGLPVKRHLGNPPHPTNSP